MVRFASLEFIVTVTVIASVVIGLALYVKYDAQFVFGKNFIKQHGWLKTGLMWVVIAAFVTALFYLWDNIV